jgi:hypothetical protein
MKGLVKKLLGCCHSGPGLVFPQREFPTGGRGDVKPGAAGAPHGALFSPIADRGLGLPQP